MRAMWLLALAAFVAAISCRGQTAAELLQRGIYAQQTEGNLDNAVLIYRQIVNSAPSQRDIAAQAQYRLAQALLEKGNLAEASKEFEKLARDYSDYGSLVDSVSGQMRPGQPFYSRLSTAQGAGPMVIRAAAFDPSKPITATGKISQVQWINPQSWLKVETANGTHSVQLAAPRTMMATEKITTKTFQPGIDVTITGILAKDGSQTALANTITSQGNLICDQAWLNPPLALAPAQ